MEIAKPGVPYASIAASTRASRPGGGAAKALVESSSAAAKAANRVSFGLADIMASWIGSLGAVIRSEEHTSELQSLMRISYAVFCLKKKKKQYIKHEQQ